MEYIDFQLRFIAQVVRDVITASASALAAVGAAITPTVAALAPAPSSARAEAMSVRVTPAPEAASDKDQVTETRQSDSAGPATPLSSPDDTTTLSAQGEIGSGSSQTTNPVAEVTSDKDAPAQRDDAVDGDATDRAESAESEQNQPDSTEADQHQPDTTSTADDTRDADEANQRPANDG